jgi:hypothetical protein
MSRWSVLDTLRPHPRLPTERRPILETWAFDSRKRHDGRGPRRIVATHRRVWWFGMLSTLLPEASYGTLGNTWWMAEAGADGHFFSSRWTSPPSLAWAVSQCARTAVKRAKRKRRHLAPRGWAGQACGGFPNGHNRGIALRRRASGADAGFRTRRTGSTSLVGRKGADVHHHRPHRLWGHRGTS